MNNSKITIMKEYNEIKNNIIEKFLTPFYKDTCIKLKNTVISDIQKRSWFPIICKDDNLIFNLGDYINITIKITYVNTRNGDWRIANFN